MKLYSGPLSMFGAKAEIALREKGVECEVEMVPFSIRHRYSPRHPVVARVNPKGQVPVLVDGTLELFESTLICEYLEEVYPAPPLWPATARERARARLLEVESDEVFFPRVFALQGLQQELDGAAANAIRLDARAHYDRLEARLSAAPFVAGEHYSFADIAALMAHFFAAFLGAETAEDHVHLRDWRRRIAQRPAVAPVLDRMGRCLSGAGLTPAFGAAPNSIEQS